MADNRKHIEIGDTVTVIAVSSNSWKSLIGKCGEVVPNDSKTSPPGKFKVDFGEFVGWYYPTQLSLDTEARDAEGAVRILKSKLEDSPIVLSQGQALSIINILEQL